MTIDPISSFAAVPGIVGLIGRLMPNVGESDVKTKKEISQFDGLMNPVKESNPVSVEKLLPTSVAIVDVANKTDFLATIVNKTTKAVTQITSMA